MPKEQNLLLVTEHFPCGTQESFLETELEFLSQAYNVHVVTTDTDRIMTRSLPKSVTFSRPADKAGKLKTWLVQLSCLFSRGYAEERRYAKQNGTWTKEFSRQTLAALVQSRMIYNYIRGLDFFEEEKPLTIYSANLNNYLYGLCCLKEYCADGIKVVARCHNANMFDPIDGTRRETLNHIINESIDAIYFSSEQRRESYLSGFSDGELDANKLKVVPMGVFTQQRDPSLLPTEFILRLVTCCPMEEDKRLPLLIDGLSMIQSGFVEWVHIGSGSKKNEVIAYAAEKLDNKTGVRYKFLGKLIPAEIYAYYKDTYFDAFLSVSASESVPTAMMEAMANHMFVVATDVDGVEDVVNDKNGILLPANITPQQLAGVLEGLCRIGKDQMLQKSEAAFRYWQQHFDAEKNYPDFVRDLAVEPIAASAPEAGQPAD